MTQFPATFGQGDFQASGSLIPPGQYVLAITLAEMRDVKSNPKNKYAYLEAEVQDGPFQGRKVFMRFNLVSDSAMAREIAEGEMESLAQATGRVVKSTEDLIAARFMGEITIEPSRDPKYPDKNEVKKFLPLHSNGDVSRGSNDGWGN